MDTLGPHVLLVTRGFPFIKGELDLLGPKFFVLSSELSLIQESFKRGSTVNSQYRESVMSKLCYTSFQ